MDHTTTTHQHCHLLTLMPATWTNECWRKWQRGFKGRTLLIFIHDKVSHQIDWILVQWMNKWDASSSTLPQKGHKNSIICTCLLCKFFFVGNLSLKSLHANTAYFLGILNFQISAKPSSLLPAAPPSHKNWYALCVEYIPDWWPIVCY